MDQTLAGIIRHMVELEVENMQNNQQLQQLSAELEETKKELITARELLAEAQQGSADGKRNKS